MRCMAMTICSFTNISLSSYPTKSNLKLSNYAIIPTAHYTSTANHTSIMVQNDAFRISNVEIHQAADTTPESTREIDENFDIDGIVSTVNTEFWCDEMTLKRRKMRRRKRRIGLNLEHMVNNKDDEEYEFVDKKARRRSRYMTAKEEAKCSWHLKERARIESIKIRLLEDMGDQDLSLSRWAEAAGISQHNLDRIICNGRESGDKITSSYYRLVISVASSYQGRGLSLQDLTQEGSIGLLRGATKFDPERGYKLSTYAYWWIRQAITRSIANKSRMIRLPGRISELLPKICKTKTLLSRKLQRFATYEEIAEAIGADASVVRLALEKNRPPISLDQAVTSHGCMSLQDILPGPYETVPEAIVKKDMLKIEIENLLKTLCAREAHVLRLYYGLNGDTPWSCEEIGRLFNLSRERVRQINSTALTKLKKIRGIDDLKYFIK